MMKNGPIIRGCLTAVVITTVLGLFVMSCDNSKASESKAVDLSVHPLYSTYKFDRTKNIVNIGIQPLYFPTGLITAAMKRDPVLKDALAQLGMEAHFYCFLKGDDVNYFIRSGDLAGGVGGDMPAISAAASMDVMALALMQKGFVSIVAGRSMLIESLQGKRIAYAFGSNAHYSLLEALSFGGLGENDVSLVQMDVTDMVDALDNGEIDAFSAWEPVPFMALKDFADMSVIHRSTSQGYIYFQRAFYEKNREAVHHILAAQIRAMRWMQFNRANVEIAGKWVMEEIRHALNVDLELTDNDFVNLAMEDIIGLLNVPFIPVENLLSGGTLYREFHFLQKIGKIPEEAEWNKISDSFNRRVLEEVLSRQEEYRVNVQQYVTVEATE